MPEHICLSPGDHCWGCKKLVGLGLGLNMGLILWEEGGGGWCLQVKSPCRCDEDTVLMVQGLDVFDFIISLNQCDCCQYFQRVITRTIYLRITHCSFWLLHVVVYTDLNCVQLIFKKACIALFKDH